MKVSHFGQSAVQDLSSSGDTVAGTVNRNLGRIYAVAGIWAAFFVVEIVAPTNCYGNLLPEFFENQWKNIFPEVIKIPLILSLRQLPLNQSFFSPLKQNVSLLPGQMISVLSGQDFCVLLGQTGSSLPRHAASVLPGHAAYLLPGRAASGLPRQVASVLPGQASSLMPGGCRKNCG
ncbi:hypothetical protein V6N11_030541 [Hibiscus sabdariffa]|uniref:Uncharacterized protein n=1 Tax=Hibiscus sabdariffa TaxID=183260 RepID=A0ABR2N799_9ROSI